jgi:transcription-repair coupling factor (superfamily II helicase)
MVDDLSILESTVSEIEEQAVKLRAESIAEGILAESFPIPYITWSELSDALSGRPCLELGYSTAQQEVDDQELSLSDSQSIIYLPSLAGSNGLAGVSSLLPSIWPGSLIKIILLLLSRARLRVLKNCGWNITFHPSPQEQALKNPLFIESSLSEGWSLGNSYLITDSEIFGWERPQPRQRPRPGAETPESAYADLHPGDWIVHVDYGLGRYVGLVQRTLEGLEREFLCVEYKNGDQVYVPIHQADRLTRYIGPDGSPPTPGNLGTQEWPETKRKVREAVQEVAQDLLDLYARRHVAEGFAFSPDNAWQSELESSFPYVETDDQVKALADIKRDMETPRPMDRLLCGDVGYGKTEVALRAAFKAVMDGRQVAVLVPTTVLAQQHYDTFRQRLSAFPVTVEMLSRFRTPREQSQILYALVPGRGGYCHRHAPAHLSRCSVQGSRPGYY